MRLAIPSYIYDRSVHTSLGKFVIRQVKFLGKEFDLYLSSQFNCFEPKILQINTLTQHGSVDKFTYIYSVQNSVVQTASCTSELWRVVNTVEGQTAFNPVIDGDYVDVN